MSQYSIDDRNIRLAFDQLDTERKVFITLKALGFKLLVTEAIHFDGGYLDQAWLRFMHQST